METKEKKFKNLKISGFVAFFIGLAGCALCVLLFIKAEENILYAVLGVAASSTILFLFRGFVQIEPNEARVMVFFGKYIGTVTDNGFFWVNPFALEKKSHYEPAI